MGALGREGRCPRAQNSLQVCKVRAPPPGLQDTKDVQRLGVTGPWGRAQPKTVRRLCLQGCSSRLCESSPAPA